jgi:L-lactate permease
MPAVWNQRYEPVANNLALSALVAALPVVVLLGLLGLVRVRAQVAFGAIGTPILTLAGVTKLPVDTLSATVGRQLPIFAVVVPFWLVWALAGRKATFEVWPGRLHGAGVRLHRGAVRLLLTLLGWLGVALTGSDTSSNALFGNLQQITAQQAGLSPVLTTAANSSGGVMAKMIDAQSIVVAGVATGQQGNEGAILRYGFWHAVGLGCLMGVLVFLQSNLLSWMIPE